MEEKPILKESSEISKQEIEKKGKASRLFLIIAGILIFICGFIIMMLPVMIPEPNAPVIGDVILGAIIGFAGVAFMLWGVFTDPFKAGLKLATQDTKRKKETLKYQKDSLPKFPHLENFDALTANLKQERSEYKKNAMLKYLHLKDCDYFNTAEFELKLSPLDKRYNTICAANDIPNTKIISINKIDYIYINGNLKLIQFRQRYSLSKPFSFDQVISCVVFEDKKQIVETNAKSKGKSGLGTALVGTALAGPVGMVAGAIIGHNRKIQTESETITNNIADYDCKITVDYGEIPATFYFHCGANHDIASEIESIIDYVISNQTISKAEEHTVSTTPLPDSPIKESDKFTQIREYKKLLDEGIITAEEFEQKKKELL